MAAQRVDEKNGIENRINLILIVPLTIKSFVNLGKFFHHSEPEFPNIRNENNALLTS